MSQSSQNSSSSSKTLDEGGLCILSLDGGGVRGLSSLYLLQSIMHRLNSERNKMGLHEAKPCEIFDLIGGTSTGGLIAIMLGRLEMSVEECINAYKELMSQIFDAPIHKSGISFTISNRRPRVEVRPRFDSSKLRTAIEKTVEGRNPSINRDTRFNIGRTGCRVFVCAKRQQNNSLAILRSYNTDRYPDQRISICDAAMATTAAPKLFEPVQIGDIGYVDGALGANNPVEWAESEATDIWCPIKGEVKPLVKCFISIGTGRQTTRPIKEDALSLLTKTVAEIALETEDTANKFLGRWRDHFDSKRYFRFNVDRGLQGVGLAEYEQAGAIEAATLAYLDDHQISIQMRNLVANLRLKIYRGSSGLESVVQAYMSRRFPSYLSKRPYLEDKNRNRERLQGTCEWFINHRSFQEWKNKTCPAFLWVSADPGCGKSVLAKSLVDEILIENPCTNKIVCYFFFKEDFESQRRVDYAICCLLHQLFSQRRELLTHSISQKLEEMDEAICESFQDLWDLLIEASTELRNEQIVCVLDAFDECEETGRRKLVQALTKLYDPAKTGYHNLKFLVTSRYYGNSRWGFRELKLDAPQIHLGGEDPQIVQQISSEINIVIRARVEELGVQRGLSIEQQQAIIEELSSRENRTYLWVHLIFEGLEENPFLTQWEFQESLRELPVSVNNAYEKILSKTKNEDTTRRLLQLVIAAETQLTENELRLTLTMRSQPRSFLELEHWGDRGRAFDFIKELCGLLVMRDSKVYLLHQTVREFLIRKKKNRNRVPTGSTWENSFSLKKAHRVLAEICLWYLLLEGDDDDETRASFKTYAATYWTAHYAKAGLKHRRQLADLVGRLLTDSDNSRRWLAARWKEKPKKAPRNIFTKSIASTLNLLEVPSPDATSSARTSTETSDSLDPLPPVEKERVLQKQLAFIQARIHSLGELTDDELRNVATALKGLQKQLGDKLQRLKKRSLDLASVPKLPELDFGRRSADSRRRRSVDVLSTGTDEDPMKFLSIR